MFPDSDEPGPKRQFSLSFGVQRSTLGDCDPLRPWSIIQHVTRRQLKVRALSAVPQFLYLCETDQLQNAPSKKRSRHLRLSYWQVGRAHCSVAVDPSSHVVFREGMKKGSGLSAFLARCSSSASRYLQSSAASARQEAMQHMQTLGDRVPCVMTAPRKPEHKRLTSRLHVCHRASDITGLMRTARDSNRLDGVLWAAAMQRMSAVEKRGNTEAVRQGWELLMAMSETHLVTLGHRELAVIAVAIAKSKHAKGKERFLEEVLQMALIPNSEHGLLSMRHLANLSWAAAATKLSAPRLFEAAAGAVGNSPGLCNSRDISQLLWAFGRASHSKLGLDILENLAKEHVSSQLLPSFGDHDMAASVWATAVLASQRSLAEKSKRFIWELAAHATARSSEFSPQGLSMLLWGTATLLSRGIDMPSAALTTACGPQIVALASKFTPQGAANILWSLSTMAKIDHEKAAGEMLSFEELSARCLLASSSYCSSMNIL